MLIFKERASLTAYLLTLRTEGKTIGFVPTMGALHEGHLSLLETAHGAADQVVCSIFVNPTQFNDPEDFKKYPVDTDEDIRRLLAAPVNVLFLPAVNEIYDQGTGALARYPFGRLESLLEGAYRPGHFQGVGQVMGRLLGIIPADYLFMGQKDYQQTLIVNELIGLLNIKTKLVTCPTLREADGLAMSSRNVRLSPEARGKAPFLYKTLLFVRDHLEQMPLEALIVRATAQLEQEGFKVDYLVIADKTLTPLTEPAAAPMICLVAAWLEGVRLIDNLLLS